MRNRDDWVGLELAKQTERLKYLDTILKGEGYCPFPPRRVFIEPTNACNLNCTHCVHDGTMKRPTGFMDLGVYKKIFEDIRNLNKTTEICLFQTGEPTLHPGIVEMVRIASVDYDFFTKMNTNGVLVDKKMSEALIENRMDYLVFSLDAISAETYSRIKRKPYFEKVMTNILDFLEVWCTQVTDFKRNMLACDVILVEEEANRHELPYIVDALKKLPIGHIETYELFNYQGAIKEANSKYAERKNIPQPEWPGCNSPWDVVGIRWNGDVVACVYDYDSKYVIGNVKHDSLVNIWNSDRMIEFRRNMATRRFDRIEAACGSKMCTECTIMWQKEYQIPTDYYAEIKRMEYYLSRAIDRVHLRYKRTDALLEKWEYLRDHRDEWLTEFYRHGSSIGKPDAVGAKKIYDTAG
ncbi:MAG: radical SAM/SPASM domain-containing protein [Candidatus Omnitrophota bacterium]